MFEARRRKMAELLKAGGMDAGITVPGPNMYYFTGLQMKPTERLSLAIITKEGQLVFVVPQVELSKVQATTQADSIFWYTDEQGPQGALQEAKQALGSLSHVGVEYGHMRVMEMEAVRSIGAARTSNLDLTIDQLRMFKDQQEIELMTAAVQICEESFEAALPFIKAGKSEVEVAAYLEFEMRKRGSEGTPFGTTVASGARGALPHGRATEKIIEEGDLIVIDFGSIYKGYVADTCRTVAIGSISDELREIYEVCKVAQQAALDVIKPGITAHEVDEAARSYIRDQGYGQYFTHRTGHGLGLSGHEEPYMMQYNKLVLKPGMAFSVEPGIYLPDKGGVRIEDTPIVTEDGYFNPMKFTKDLITL